MTDLDKDFNPIESADISEEKSISEITSAIPDTVPAFSETADPFTEVSQIPSPSQTAAPVYGYDRRPGKVGTLFFCLWVAFAFLLIQNVISLIALIPVMVKLLMESGFDMDQFFTLYSSLIEESPFMAGMQLIATASGALAMGLWYYLGYVRKDRLSGTYQSVRPKLKGIKNWLFLISGTAACYLSALLLDIIAAAMFPAAAEELNNNMNLVLGKYAWIGMLFVVLLAPIGEECAVRGIMLRRSEKVFSMTGCIVISAVFFGLLHMNLIQGLYVLPTGAFLGYVSYKYHSVIPCIFCHMLFNLIGMTVPIEISGVPTVAICTLLTLVFAFSAIFFGRQLSINNTEEQA